MADARVVIDADAHAVVVEARKSVKAIGDVTDAIKKATAEAKLHQDAQGRWREENGRFVSSARKAELGIVNQAKATQDSTRVTETHTGATRESTRASERWTRVQVAGNAAVRRQVLTLHELGRAARASTFALGGLAAAGLTHLIKTGMDFEKQMSAVNAVTGASAKQFEALRKSALAAGQATIFSAGEAAKAQEELAKGGLSVKNILEGGLTSALSLASAGSLELADAAAITANAMNLFAIDGKDSVKVADAMATAANQTTADVADFGLALAQGGAVAKMSGLSFTQTMLALEALAKSGVKSSDAGTSLKTALIQLVKPTSTQAKMAEALHLSFIDANGEMKSMGAISAMLRDKLGDMGKAHRTATLATLAGTDGVRTLNALYDAGPEKLKRWENGLAKSGTALDVAKKKQDNVSGAFEQLTGSIQTVEASLFHSFQEPLKKALLDATNEVNTKGKEVQQFFERVFDMPSFQAADLGGKLRILLDEFDKTGLPEKMRDLIVQGFTNGLNAALPVVIHGAEKLAVEGAKAFGRAFVDADPLSRALMAGYLLHKTGALSAFFAYGKKAASQAMAGAAAGSGATVVAAGGAPAAMAPAGAAPKTVPGTGVVLAGPGMPKGAAPVAMAPAAAAGWKTAAKGIGKQFGAAAGLTAAVMFGPEIVKGVGRAVSSRTQGADGLPSLPKNISRPGMALLPKQMEENFTALKKAGDTRALSEMADGVRKIADEFPRARGELNLWADAVDGAAGTASDQFRLMQGAAGKSLKAISQTLADTSFEIKQRFGYDTAKAKDALARNMMLAAQAIRKSMNDGKISARTGMREIEDLFVKALASYGFTKAEAINRAHGKEFSGKSSPGGTTHTNAARGALMQVGRPGAAGVDNVPAVLNGQRAMVADGEQIAVFNRHQQQALNARLADQGGLAGFFASNRKPHSYATGGMIGKANRLDHMHLPYKWGGGHGSSTGFDASGMDCSATVSYILGIPPRTSGDLMGYGRPGPGPVTIYANPQHTFMSIKGRGFGTSGENPGGGPGWLSYSARGGFAVSHVGLGAAAALRRAKMKGGLGAVGTLGQRALDVTRSAAQQRLDSLSAPGMDPGAVGGGPNAGDWHGALKDIATERGWSVADWMWIIGHESGGRVGVSNAGGSGAFGLGQLMPSNYKRLGGGPGSSGGEQVRAMAAYVTERYGNPTAARAYWEAHHSYATGGLLNSTGATPTTKGTPAKGKKKPGPRKPLTLNQVRKTLGQRLKQGYPVKGMDQLENLVGDNGTVERLKKDLDQARQLHELTDEEKTHTVPGVGKDAQGNLNPDVEVLNTDGYTDDRGHHIGGIKQHVAEDLAELMKAGMIQGGYDTAIKDLPRLKAEIDQGITERNARVKLIERLATLELRRRRQLEAAIKRLQARKITTAASRRSAINDAADSADADKSALRDQISNLQEQQGGAVGADKLSLSNQIKAKREQIAAVGRRITTLRRGGGDQSALNLHVHALRDDLAGVKGSMEHWLGTSSDDAAQPSAWQSRSVGGALRQDLEQRWRPSRERLASLAFDLPDQRFAAMIDVASIRKDYEDWRDTPAPKAPDLAAGGATGDSGLADLLKAQLDEERQRSGMLAAQFDVFKGFAPLLQGRMLGSFARGLSEVRETGLAVIHKGESISPDPQGPFGRQTAGIAPAPVQVTVHLDSDLRPLVSRMRAEIDDRAARVVSEQLGRNARLMVSARGG